MYFTCAYLGGGACRQLIKMRGLPKWKRSSTLTNGVNNFLAQLVPTMQTQCGATVQGIHSISFGKRERSWFKCLFAISFLLCVWVFLWAWTTRLQPVEWHSYIDDQGSELLTAYVAVSQAIPHHTVWRGEEGKKLSVRIGSKWVRCSLITTVLIIVTPLAVSITFADLLSGCAF